MSDLPENLPDKDFTPQEKTPNSRGSDPIGEDFLYNHEKQLYRIASQYMQQAAPKPTKMQIEELFRQQNPFGVQEG